MLAYDLENRHKERSVIPGDKAVAFVCDLLEDLADEWAVKPLFLYRWWDPEDQAYVSRWAGEEWSVSEAATGSAEEIEQFRQRQISRFWERRRKTSRCWKKAISGRLRHSSRISA